MVGAASIVAYLPITFLATAGSFRDRTLRQRLEKGINRVGVDLKNLVKMRFQIPDSKRPPLGARRRS
jgi:hypothetical protein